MGGPAVGFLPALPTPTVPRGATMDEAMRAMHDMPGMNEEPSRPRPSPSPTTEQKPTPHDSMPGMKHP
jgi:hypothetical protein